MGDRVRVYISQLDSESLDKCVGYGLDAYATGSVLDVIKHLKEDPETNDEEVQFIESHLSEIEYIADNAAVLIMEALGT